jgi:hypothetical protein
MRDNFNNLNFKKALAPASVGDNTAQVCAIIDRQGYEALTYLIELGSIADADATFAVLLEEGDDSGLSDAATVAAADMLGTPTLAGFQFDSDNALRKLGYVGSKRYTRMTITPTSNASAALLGVTAILGAPLVGPTVNPPA